VLITSIKPNVTRAEAARRFKESLREVRRGRLEAVVDFYVPYRLFEVEVTNAARHTSLLFAIDSVAGHLDLYGFESPPTPAQCIDVETGRAIAALLSEPDSLALLKEKVRRSTYVKGFFKVKDLEVSGCLLVSLYLPYWVGIYRRKDRAALEVIDAVRNSFEGAKLREIVTRWFKLKDEG
jgi:hypothetical protein